jgi:beta-glucuronidase
MGCIYFCLNDYRSKNGETGEGRYKRWDCGLTDMWFGKKTSYNVYRGLASPVFFEYVKQSAKGTEADVSIVVKNDLPSYILRDYKLVYETASGTMQEISLPVLKPGDKFKVTIQNISPDRKPIVMVVRPTGEMAAEY